MPKPVAPRQAAVPVRDESPILREWMRLQLETVTRRADLITERDVRQQSQRFLGALPSGPDDPRQPPRS